MNFKTYHLISGIVAWLFIAYLFKWKIPFVSKIYPYLDKLTKNKATTVLTGMAAGALMGNYYKGGQSVGEPLYRLTQEVWQMFDTLTFKAVK